MKLKVLEINNIDLIGKVFNGYNLIEDLDNEEFDVKQLVIIKQSNNKKVKKLLNSIGDEIYYKLQLFEDYNSIHNIFSITSPALFESNEYKEADIIHIHMFHNFKLSIPSIKRIANEKKLILSLHDPWFLTGRCVHYYECNKWINGCKNCKQLTTFFPLKEDNCSFLWDLKKECLSNENISIIMPSNWMYENVKKSSIFEKITDINVIPFGIDLNKYKPRKNARQKYNISKDDFVIFLRAQNEFKGTQYVLEALKKLRIKKKITILTCSEIGLLNEVKNKYNIIDLGNISEEEVINAMNACDIFLMPSIGESFGMMAIEAMACEKTVVVFNNTALPSVTKAPTCGVLVKNKDANDLKEKIEYLINNPEEIKRRGKLGRKICKSEYDHDKYIKKIGNVYKSSYEKFQIKNKKTKKIVYNKKNYEEIKKAIDNFLKYNKYTKLNINDLNDYNITESINEYIYTNYIKEKKYKISFKSRIKNTLKKNKYITSIYRKIKNKKNNKLSIKARIKNILRRNKLIVSIYRKCKGVKHE